MLPRGSSNTRPTRGHGNNRSRGRALTSRGASSSSSLATNGDNNFDRERLENAARREARGQNLAGVNGRGQRAAFRGSKQVRFAVNNDSSPSRESSPPKVVDAPPGGDFLPRSTVRASNMESDNPFSGASNVAREYSPPKPVRNPFGRTAINSSTFGSTSTAPVNMLPGASVSGSGPVNPFTTGTSTPAAFVNPFTPWDQESNTPILNPFLKTSNEQVASASLPKPQESIFATPLVPIALTASFPTSQTPSLPPQSLTSASAFTTSKPLTSLETSTQPSVFASSSLSVAKPTATSQTAVPSFFDTSKSTQWNEGSVKNQPLSSFPASSKTSKINNFNGSDSSRSTSEGPASSNIAGRRMFELLRVERITAPAWPETPGNPRQKAAVEAVWQAWKGYRSRVRNSLIRGGLLDDPDKPKKLSEAVDFKGTCEEMCPEFEKLTRIMESDVPGPEKELAPDGKSLWPSPKKMVKAMARSAAGQESPLPMDVRSPLALRRTIDYLIHEVLGSEGDLQNLHGFLWDRTRAVRRDFVFHSSMNPAELADQINCLERITRFHVISLHQMSRQDLVADSFVEQQELEQLGKALLSLVHTYDDCKAQGVGCENESEFRAYYILFNGKNPGILETVQDWGWKFWGESNEVKAAISLVEALQTTTDTQGPLKPSASTDIAQNAYSRFFCIVEDRDVSYTMACFAEIHFNAVRRSALKTILTSYRKQRDQAKDWTLEKLNIYLNFDNEDEVLEFGEAYGLRFEESEGGEHLVLFPIEQMEDPFPPLKQRHSTSLVERKRGNHSLPEVIDNTVYDETPAGPSADIQLAASGGFQKVLEVEEETLFIPDDEPPLMQKTISDSEASEESRSQASPFGLFQTLSGTASQPSQLTKSGPESSFTFDRKEKSDQFRPDFFSTPVSHEDDARKHIGELPKSSSVISRPFTANMPTISAPKPIINDQDFKNSTSFGTLQSQSSSPFIEVPQNTGGLIQTSQGPFSTGGFKTTSSYILVTTPSVSDTSSPDPESAPETRLQAVSASFTNKTSVTSPLLNGASSTMSVNYDPESLFDTITQEPRPLDNHTNSPASLLTTSKGPEPSVDPKLVLDHVAHWLVNGKQGIIEHFAEITIESLLREVALDFVEEERLRVAAIETKEIKDRYLSIKYFRHWRLAAHRLWLRRQGREARKARQKMTETLRSSSSSRTDDIVDDFKASIQGRPRNSNEHQTDPLALLQQSSKPSSSSLQAGSIEISGGKDHHARSIQPPKSQIERHSHRPRSRNPRKCESEDPSESESARPLGRSLFSDPTYLTGGSRIHLMEEYDVRDEHRPQISGVQTDYFRLKARGISTLPNGSPLARTVANDILHRKRMSDAVGKPSSSRTSRMISGVNGAKAVPKPPTSAAAGNATATDIKALKARAMAIMAGDQKTRQKRTFDDEDEALFTRAKRVRERMDEGERWFKDEVERVSQSRSFS